MAALGEIYFKKETLQTMLKTLDAKKEKGINITVSVNDETNEYGQNMSAFVAQTIEEREEGKKKYYVGNGKIFWTNGEIITAKKKENIEVHDAEIVSENEDDDLPF